MSPAFRSKQVKTRKSHLCLGCLKTFQKGTSMSYTKGITDYGFFSYYLCQECLDVIDDVGWSDLADADGGLLEGFVNDWRDGND